MNKKIISIILPILIVMGVLTLGSGVALAWDDYCNSNVSGQWWAFYPNDRQCGTSYYTYNTTSLDDEESWFKNSAGMYTMCGEATPPFGPTYYYDIGSREYIPSPDTSQTNTGAHYYRWGVDDSYAMVGNIAQYSAYGFAYNYTATWNWHDAFKLSDWTSDSLYSKHVDLDAYGFDNCP
jgi:hypothetical protein